MEWKKGNCFTLSHISLYLFRSCSKKIDDRSEKYIFIGYSDQSKAYRLFNPITKKFVVSRDVKFLEDKSWNEMENNTCPNPFIKLDEPQESTKKHSKVTSSRPNQ